MNAPFTSSSRGSSTPAFGSACAARPALLRPFAVIVGSNVSSRASRRARSSAPISAACWRADSRAEPPSERRPLAVIVGLNVSSCCRASSASPCAASCRAAYFCFASSSRSSIVPSLGLVAAASASDFASSVGLNVYVGDLALSSQRSRFGSSSARGPALGALSASLTSA